MPSGTYIEPLTPCWREHSARGANRTGNYSYNLKKKKIARVASHNINHCKSIFLQRIKKQKKQKSNCFLRKTPAGGGRRVASDDYFFIPKRKKTSVRLAPAQVTILITSKRKKLPVWLHTI